MLRDVFRRRSVLVGSRLPIGEIKHKKNDQTDEWDESDQQHPATLARVVQTTNRNGQGGQDDPKRVDGVDDSPEPSQRVVGPRQDDGKNQEAKDDYEVNKHEPPVFGSPRSAGEVGIFLRQDRLIDVKR